MIPLKQFLAEKAETLGITMESAYVYWWRGKFKVKTIFKKNKRVIYVTP